MKSRDVNDTLREHGTEGLRQALDKAPRKGGESSGDSRRQQHERNTRHSDETLILPSPKQPFEVAKVFLREFATHDDGLLKLRFWRGDWWAWRGSHWRRVDARAVRRVLYRLPIAPSTRKMMAPSRSGTRRGTRFSMWSTRWKRTRCSIAI